MKIGFVLFVIVLAGTMVISSYAGGPIAVDSHGVWSFSKLGYSDIHLYGDQQVEAPSVEYFLPEDAAQGEQGWYRCFLKFRVDIDETTQDGTFYLAASTNGYACALIKFEVSRRQNNLVVNWSTVDIVQGEIRRTTYSPTIEGTYSDYLQIAGVQPGKNVMTFGTKKLGGVKVNRVHISAEQSGIEYTSISPPDLHMEMELPSKQAVAIGDYVKIGFTIENEGDLPATNVEIIPRYPSESLELVDNVSYHFPYLEGSKEGEFKFKALVEGKHDVIVYAKTNSGIARPASRILVPVNYSTSMPFQFPTAGMAFVTALIGILGISLVYSLIRLMERRAKKLASKD